MTHLSDAESAARKALATMEFPRLLCRADGTQVRVETLAEAKALLDDGLTVLPVAPSPHDGGTPNVPPKVQLPQAVQDAIASAVQAAQPAPDDAPEDDDAPKKRKR